jgi:hypothetical protein
LLLSAIAPITLFRKTEASLAHTHEFALADHQMVEHFHVEQLASLDDLASDQDILNIMNIKKLIGYSQAHIA